MNTKQRRKSKRDSISRGIESKVDEVKPSHTFKEMNDYCPKGFTKCGHPIQEFEFDKCYGRYKTCKYY